MSEPSPAGGIAPDHGPAPSAIPSPSAPGPLEGLRVVEVAGPLGEYAGKLLADLGADVILVEPPGGAARRRLGPFLGDRSGDDRSLSFAYLHTSKRGIVLDLDDAQGQTTFRRLAATADVVLESEPVGTMTRRGLDHAALSAGHPALVTTSITPFGSDGPYADYEATDLVLMALGGLLYLGGYSDTSPVRAAGDQAILAAGQFAAIGTLLAVLTAEQTGQGQVVDVSAQECVVMAHETAVPFWDLEQTVRRRGGEDQRQAGVGVYPCQDGEVYLLAGGLGLFWDELVDWLEQEGVDDAAELREPRWRTIEWIASPAGKAVFRERFAQLAMRRTKAELYADAKRQRIPLCPIATPADLVASPQLLARHFFVDLAEGLPGTTLRLPGAPYQPSDSPWRIQRPAPALGEHTDELLAELTDVRAPAMAPDAAAALTAR